MEHIPLVFPKILPSIGMCFKIFHEDENDPVVHPRKMSHYAATERVAIRYEVFRMGLIFFLGIFASFIA